MYFPIIDVLKENFIAKIPSIVTQWLTDNVDPVGSAVVVDESLSISGAAADAKITGDLKSDLMFSNEGKETFGLYASFVNGTQENGTYNHWYIFRVTSENIFVFDRDLLVTAKTGYRFFLAVFENGAFVRDTNWISGTSYRIPKGTNFKIVIAKATEDQSVTANIPEFVEAVTFLTVDNIKHCAKLIVPAGKYVDYNYNTKIITIPAHTVLVNYDSEQSYLAFNTAVTLAHTINSNALKLYIDTQNQTIIEADYSDWRNDINERYAFIGCLSISVENSTFAGDFAWSINGEPYGVPKEKVTGFANHLLAPASPKFVMHRGYSSAAPENTIPAFVLAGKAGAFGIETDVYQTTDGVFVLMHDNDVSRTTDGTGNIYEKTYAEVQALTIDAGPNIDQYPNLKVPTLAEYLAVCRRYGSVANIDIKHIASYEALITEIRNLGMIDSCIFSTDGEYGIKNVRQFTNAPIILFGYEGTTAAELCAIAELYTDVWVSPSISEITDISDVNAVHAKHIPVSAWATNDTATAETLIGYGVDCITSDSIAKLSND